MKPPISTRTELINALRTAAELEHGIMAQYLFAAYSIKRYTYEGLDPVQLEHVRRWGSSLTLISRQEMEHLGLALNLLSAIGGTPSFTRPNMPQHPDYYGKAGIELTLTRADYDTLCRFQRFESPDDLIEGLKPGEPVDQGEARKWCGRKKDLKSREQLEAYIEQEEEKRKTPRLAVSAPILDFGWDSVQELYQTIREGFETLTALMGESNLFVGKPSLQIFGGPTSKQSGTMNDLNQYGVDLIEVNNLASARQAITMILEQGEGIAVNASYLRWTHFCLFTNIRQGMDDLKLGKIAARPVVPNPMTRRYPDVAHKQVTMLTNGSTLQVAQLFNESYELMLLLLLYLYSDNVKTQAQVNDLMDAAFFPLMTMFIRPLAEVLTEMPAFENPKDKT
ncbi:MAG: ferritin-like domain-containing protein, partial [Thermoanaerobaculia bacterium]